MKTLTSHEPSNTYWSTNQHAWKPEKTFDFLRRHMSILPCNYGVMVVKSTDKTPMTLTSPRSNCRRAFCVYVLLFFSLFFFLILDSYTSLNFDWIIKPRKFEIRMSSIFCLPKDWCHKFLKPDRLCYLGKRSFSCLKIHRGINFLLNRPMWLIGNSCLIGISSKKITHVT